MSEAAPGPDALFVVVSGGPGSGKSTLARALAPALGLPLLAKDTIKEAMLEDLDVPDVEASRVLGRASVSALIALAKDCGHAVLDSSWHRSRAQERLVGLPGQVIEVHCRCEPEVMARRFWERAATRNPGHFDNDRTTEDLWNPDTVEPVAGGWPVIEVVTTSGTPDVEAVVEAVLAAYEESAVHPQAPQAKQEWVVWRDDGSGQRQEVTRRESKEVAQKVADMMAATGGRATFSVGPA